MFATGVEIVPRAPKKTTLDEKTEKAKELNRQGLSNGKIARMMGVSKATIKNWLETIEHRPKKRTSNVALP